MSRRARRALAYLIAFTLPLGFLGILGIVLLGLFLFASLPQLCRHPWTAALTALPLALVTMLSTLLSPHNSQSLLPAVGFAILLTIGLQLMQIVAGEVDPDGLIRTFLLGTVVLAFSVFADYLFQWHHIPSGLFWTEGLHNWTASYLVLAFPVGLHMSLRSPDSAQTRIAAGLTTVMLVSGVAVSLSWVGLLGILVSGLAYSTLRWPRSSGAILLSLLILTVAIPGTAQSFLVRLRIGNHDMAELGDVFFARLRILAEGLELASMRPALGWGSSHGNISPILQQQGVGTYYLDDIALPHFHNLYVQTLFETGLLGFVSLILLLSALFIFQAGPWSSASRAALLGFAATQLFDYNWAQATLVLGFWLIMSVNLATGQPGAWDSENGHQVAT